MLDSADSVTQTAVCIPLPPSHCTAFFLISVITPDLKQNSPSLTVSLNSCKSRLRVTPFSFYFGSCPEGQTSSRTKVPAPAFQNKQPETRRCQLTLNFLSIATTATTMCHRGSVLQRPPTRTYSGTSACMRAHGLTNKR